MAKLLTSDKMGKLIFSDEPNLYYNAILNGEPTLDEEYLQSSGIITFIVPDGIVHSIFQKTFQASLNHERVMEMTISNTGTESVPVDYEIKHNHENGFIGIVSEYGVIQLGHVNEMDMEERKSRNTSLIIGRHPSMMRCAADQEYFLIQAMENQVRLGHITMIIRLRVSLEVLV